jgi:hypothetical protein
MTGSARCQTQKISTVGKFHSALSEIIKRPLRKVSCVVEIDVIPGAANANPGIAMWTAVARKNYSRKTAHLFEKINHALVTSDRERIGRQASPSAAIIDSQSVKTTEAARAA